MKNFICVYDFETDGRVPEVCEPVQVAACIVNHRTLEIVEDSEFVSYMKPEGIDDEGYFEEHKDTIHWHAKNYNPDYGDMKQADKDAAAMAIFETWKSAPEQKQVWGDFNTYLLKYNTNQARKSRFSAPIRAGINIRRFDNVICDRLCARFGYLTKDKEQKIFHPRDVIDIMDMAFLWFENLSEPKAYNMEALRDFFGMPQAGAHDALNDVRDEAAVIQRFLRLHRSVAPKVHFKNCMAKKATASV